MICRCNYDMLSALFLCAYIFLMNSLTYMSWVKVFYCYLATIICCLQQLMMDKYQWNHCEFSFSNKSYLLVHLYTHSDDWAYHYTYCYISYTREYLLEDILGHTMKKIYINVGIVKWVFPRNSLESLCNITHYREQLPMHWL